QIGFADYKTRSAKECGPGTVKNVHADIDRVGIYTEGVVIGKLPGVEIRYGSDQVVLKLEEGKTGGGGNGRTAANGKEDSVDSGHIDHGDEPAAGEPVIACVRV